MFILKQSDQCVNVRNVIKCSMISCKYYRKIYFRLENLVDKKIKKFIKENLYIH